MDSNKKVNEEVYGAIADENKQISNEVLTSTFLAKYIDHTLLKPDASVDQIRKVCNEAKEYNFASVCVNPCYIKFVADQLAESGIKACTVIGFPLGATASEVKAEEARSVIEMGAQEVDMVINIGALKSGDWDLVKRDIEGVVNAARGKALVKVIIETCLLTDEEKIKVCTICKLAGANFVKTSTGFSTGGATVEDVRLMRETVGGNMGVKASGGIRDFATAKAMIEAGATRLGTSSGVKIVSGQSESKNSDNY